MSGNVGYRIGVWLGSCRQEMWAYGREWGRELRPTFFVLIFGTVLVGAVDSGIRGYWISQMLAATAISPRQFASIYGLATNEWLWLGAAAVAGGATFYFLMQAGQGNAFAGLLLWLLAFVQALATIIVLCGLSDFYFFRSPGIGVSDAEWMAGAVAVGLGCHWLRRIV
jgi:hypothetical protein